ncbi:MULTISPECIES: MFS transporter [unclassified Chelatococcus]|uniref:MFS transporter n=1 Tax=unclassified Chelatococcus TaxID=2638111 RepID=UPI001BCB1796|nr:MULTISPECIES: MFS transporter [unclassified Chelatococcus]MBS7700482.1 MFS transporter [Chelatococcus sp. YT9]MBX3556278.1 MFS transporter [Chelatococcus sp.]
MRQHFRVLTILALTQITGWGAVGVLPVIAEPISLDFRSSLPSVFVATTVMFVAMGIAAPWASWAFRRFGTREVMAAGAALIGLGLCLLALSPNLPVFWGSWALTGVAGAMFLTTSAYAYIAEYAGDRARSLIGTLMVVTGLAGSIFWPVTAFLETLVGWRGAVLVYASVMILIVGPVVRYGLAPTRRGMTTDNHRGNAQKGPVFVLLVAAIALNSFVTFGVEAVGIQFLQAMGMELAAAVAIASLLGVFKVAGRVIDLLGGGGWDGLSTGIVAGAMIPMGLAAIWIGGAGTLAIAGYLLLFGIGSGAFAVARATMPLVFYNNADYAAAMASIALPMNLINALAPPTLAFLMSGIGAQGVFAMLGGLSLAAFGLLLRLNFMRVRRTVAG